MVKNIYQRKFGRENGAYFTVLIFKCFFLDFLHLLRISRSLKDIYVTFIKKLLGSRTHFSYLLVIMQSQTCFGRILSLDKQQFVFLNISDYSLKKANRELIIYQEKNHGSKCDTNINDVATWSFHADTTVS